ncbi:aminodeoxychorismate lyase [Aliidiomarina minuta]|uniref:Aminodeoxychorismate lyase n=1 Tax=Aliidiomarina minuta TaxID=880057 RepID=A0A432W6E1_9GAMM|nr:aminodeoxychorismate lyase [Aliidiomarina minuta]RUO25643.1 aminodeoxychorismate lyase [Aliidiomarina minuta]
MTELLLNGQPGTDISCLDRGLQYGDGFFTTIRVSQGKPELWSQHLARITECSQRLGLETAEPEVLLNEISQVAQRHAECAVRITFTRGVGGFGYTPPELPAGNRIVRATKIPAHYADWRKQGIRLQIAEQQLGQQPMLAGLKTLNRLEQVLLKKEQQQRAADDLLVLDSKQKVCETTVANIFWQQGGQWFTPSLRLSGVAGVVRAELLQNNEVTIGDYPLQSLYQAERAFICNALLGLVPVTHLADYELPLQQPYPLQWRTLLEEV